MIKKRNLNLVLLFLLFGWQCNAQSKVPIRVGVGDRIRASTIVIYNNSKDEKTIILGVSNKLDTFKLRGEESWLSPVFLKNPSFKMQTNKQFVEYQLLLFRSYMIYWNSKKNVWDLKTVKNFSNL